MANYKLKDHSQKWLDDLKIDLNHNQHQWYIITVVGGNEQKVVADLKNKIKGYGLASFFSDIKIIKQKIKEVKIYEKDDAPKNMKNKPDVKWETVMIDGVIKYRCTRIKEQNKFRGYVFIKVDMTRQVWYLIRNTQMVTGLVGSSGKNTTPHPVSEDEIVKMIHENDRASSQVKLEENNEQPQVDLPEVDAKEVTLIKDHEDDVVYDFKLNQSVRILSDNFYDEIGTISKIDNAKKMVEVQLEFFGRLNTLNLSFKDIAIYDGDEPL
ncbi:transcription termination/antitermination protein NusG [Ureaplasma zalophigenitalium]|uniref:Transcription termination/antitermination protein NusG n=1 Tax=Ureaplasma zalophigenitalium TaxID=907723 RepID=A0ABT3BP30_9BACT|nr:transcription termination/antitermination protein NusG [Ureaplasma zalophigenitalium]MCV3753867.1 transcription termination/antitermination protein NusG [Ureaplasma zalophigenitalium]